MTGKKENIERTAYSVNTRCFRRKKCVKITHPPHPADQEIFYTRILMPFHVSQDGIVHYLSYTSKENSGPE
jgi:hypothetical protein